MTDPHSSHGLVQWHGTTIIGVKKGGKTVIAGDGQVSMGNTVMKPNARKVRRLGDVMVNPAGGAGNGRRCDASCGLGGMARGESAAACRT